MSVFIPLKRCARVQYGLGQPPKLADDGVAIIRATNIFRGRILANDLIRARVEDLPLDRAPLLSLGEVLVVRSGAYTGDSALITQEWVGAAPGYDLRLTPGRRLEPRFLAYTMLGRRALDQIDLAKARAAQPHLNAEDLGEVGVLDAPLSNQRVIADYLDTETVRIDALVAKKRRMIDLLVEKRRAVVERSVTAWGRDEEIRAGEPRTDTKRNSVRLRHVARLVRGCGFPHEHQGADSGAFPFFKVGDFNLPGNERYLSACSNWISAESAHHLGASTVPPGSILLPKIGAALLGNARRITTQESIFDNNVLAVVPKGIDSRFLTYWMSTVDLCPLANPGPVPSLDDDALRDLRVSLPDRAGQGRVADYLDSATARFDALIAMQRNAAALLRERRQALITDAVNGELALAGLGE